MIDDRDPAGPRPTDAEIDVYGLTHPGKERAENEDHFLICQLRKQIDVYLTGTTLDRGFVLRICVLNFRTHLDRVRLALDDIRDSVQEIRDEHGGG